MEDITKEEMRKGTAPSRAELIAFTPLEEVLKKESWNDVDVEILVAHRSQLSSEVLAKLGIEVIKPKTPEEVAAETAVLKEAIMTTAKESVDLEEATKVEGVAESKSPATKATEANETAKVVDTTKVD